MTTNNKGRNGGDRATQKTYAERNHTATAARIKALIVGAALWGLLPLSLADWIIRRGGLRDA